MLQTLEGWLASFERRAEAPPELPAGTCLDPLSPEERARIGRSLATFQLGEQSEGRTLLASASRYAARHECPALVRITECFIREEQRHAAMLRALLQDNGSPLVERNWTDQLFRRLRRLVGFELATTVLITAEMIGLQYYRALLNSTDSKRLRAICSLFMQDEALHVAYESQLLLAMRARRIAPLRALVTLAHAGFHLITALTVWCAHRGVLRFAGYTLKVFLRTCANHYALYFLAPRAHVSIKPCRMAISVNSD